MAYAISVPHNIVCDSGAQTTGVREGCPRDGPWAEVKFKCAWGDRFQLCSDLLGTWTVLGNYSAVLRTPALVYAPSPQLFCTDILSIECLGKPGFWSFPFTYPWLTGQIAVVTARFSIPGYTQDGSDQSGQPYTRLSCVSSSEFITIPNTVYLFADGSPIPQAAGFTMPQIEYTWTRYKMPFIPDVFFANYIGTVNSDIFRLSKSFAAAAGTVLFLPGSCQPDGNTQAMFTFEYGFPFTYQVDYKFMWRSIPWNYALHPNREAGTAPYYGFEIVTDVNGNPPYTPTQFTGVFP